ncbi:MAG: IS110 family transposase [Opitutales bacterium]
MKNKKDIKQRKRNAKDPEGLPVIRADAGGLDIGSREIWACAPAFGENPPKIQRFDTTTSALEKLAQWLKEHHVGSVAMESTGVYWIPVYEILEANGFEVLLVNARQVKGVPGRKTDVQDCQWIQKLHACGLLKGSFRPHESICALRSIVRELDEVVSQRSMILQKIQKSLDQMNVRVHHAVSDISGVTGMRIIRAIVSGERDPQVLAEMRDRCCKKSESEIAEHLKGTWREEHLFNLKMSLQLYDTLQEVIADYDGKIKEILDKLHPGDYDDEALPKLANKNKESLINRRGDAPMRQSLFRLHGVDLCTIDGINVGTALTIWSEMGTDWSSFATEKHFISYVGLAPKMAISGGKPVRGKPKRTGTTTRMAKAFRMAATTLRRSKTALGVMYRRYARIKGASHAVFIMARMLAKLVYRMICFGQQYVDIGMEAQEALYQKQRLKGLENAAKSLGYNLLPMEAA